MTEALLYHDGFTIRGVTFAPDPQLAECFEPLAVPVELAGQFVRGELDHRTWSIWNGQLRNRETLVLDLLDDHYVKLSTGSLDQPVRMIVTVYQTERRIVWQLESPFIRWHSAVDHLNFMLVAQDDPSVVVAAIRVPVQTLLDDGLYDVHMASIDLSYPFDIYTRRLLPCSVEYATAETNLMLRLPHGHFVDLMRCTEQPVQRGLQIVIESSINYATLMLVGGGVERYKRRDDDVRLIFSMSGDPSLILHTARITVADVCHGIQLELPPILTQTKFDVWLPLLFRQAGLSWKHDS